MTLCLAARTRICRLPLFLALVAAAPVLAQQQPATISVTGAVARPLQLSRADLDKFPRASVSTTSNGIVTKYEGVWLSEVLSRAGVPLGESMRGAALSSYVIAKASDGYQVVFSLGELDPAMTDGQFLLADTADGKPMFGERGDFRLVIPKDKRGARSIRMLTELSVVQLRR